MNNRQAGRRRGRGGQQRQGGGNPNQGNGNRIDNRARGNAAQLLEKYKNLARDAQMQGDRVNTEYYLQFADHYFRVLSETRSRFEEQNQQRRQRDDADGEDEDFEFEAEGNRADEPREESRQREPRQDREPREGRRERDDGRRNGRANGNGYANGHRFENEEEGADAPAPEALREENEGRQEREPRRRTRTRREAVPAEAPQGIDAAILPPAFGIEASGDAEEAPKKPRRRRVAKSDDVEAPPAA